MIAELIPAVRRARIRGLALPAVALLCVLVCAGFGGEPQNPSPMIEHTREHPRIEETRPDGRREALRIGTLFVPAALAGKADAPLLVFLHGGAWLPEVAAAGRGMAAIVIQSGRPYGEVFADAGAFPALLKEAAAKAGMRWTDVTLGGWSAGCGGIREILRAAESVAAVRDVLLIDGIHTGYTSGTPGPKESEIDTAALAPVAAFAREAMAGRKRLLVTHSEIFPGTFASTTETADWLVRELGVKRRAVLEWGPMKMQRLSDATSGAFQLASFAGNAAPDHVDQLHALPDFLGWLDRLPHAYDFVLRGGSIVDGAGNPATRGDIAVKGGRIAAVGAVAGTGRREFDATGLVVAPGFIDVHTHAEDIEEQPRGENFLRMGVTTIVLGNCGSSELNVGEFFHRIEAATFSPNVATLIGHGTVRRAAMHGAFDRVPTDAELGQMRTLVRRGMDDGALGISTGLIYLPGAFAKTEEIIEVAKVAAAHGGIYATHQRSETGEIFQSLDEIFRIAREAGIRAEISHLKIGGPANWGKSAQVLEAIENARAGGLDITQDQYVYTASSTGISQLVPEAMLEGGGEKFRARLADPAAKSAAVAKMKETLRKRGSPDYSYAVIASYKTDPSLDGRNLAEAAKKVRGSDALDAQIELVFEIVKNGGATGIFHGMNEDDLQAFMRHPNTMFACDSGVRRLQDGVPHPRGYGNNARVLGEYVREKKVLRLEDAVRRMTGLPARTFRIAGRGELRAGFHADITVFDPRTVAGPATYADPHHYGTGFRWVFVNGVIAVENDAHTGARPGQVLRRTADAPQ